jgi:hypothetical protein
MLSISWLPAALDTYHDYVLRHFPLKVGSYTYELSSLFQVKKNHVD